MFRSRKWYYFPLSFTLKIKILGRPVNSTSMESFADGHLLCSMKLWLRHGFVCNLHDSQILKAMGTMRSLKLTSWIPQVLISRGTSPNHTHWKILQSLWKHFPSLSRLTQNLATSRDVMWWCILWATLIFQRGIQAWFKGKGLIQDKKKNPLFP